MKPRIPPPAYPANRRAAGLGSSAIQSALLWVVSLAFSCLAGCNAIPQAPEADRETLQWDACEVVFRRLFQQNSTRLGQEAAWFFLEFNHTGSATDPPPGFLQRFANNTPRVLGVSQAIVQVNRGVIYRVNGDAGLLFRVWNIEWLDNRTVKVDAECYADGLNAEGAVYTLQRQDGRWVIVNEEQEWVS